MRMGAAVAAAVIVAAGVATGFVLTADAADPNADRLLEAWQLETQSSGHKKWAQQNPGEASKLNAYAANGGAAPTLVTLHGQAWVLVHTTRFGLGEPPSSGWGSFTSTGKVWPDGSWRPYAASSAFNKPVPANPTVRANSAAVIAKLLASGGGPGNVTAGAPASGDYTHPHVWSRPTDPLYTIHCTKYACDDLEGRQVRIPVGARPAGGGDGHLAVIDQTDGTTVDLYEASVPSGNGGTLNVGSGGVSDTDDGTGLSVDVDGDGRLGEATAARFGLLAGIIRAQELAAGRINHALFITVPCGATSPAFVAPALKGGSFCADNTDRVPMGARLWLDMTQAEIDALAIPAWKKTILRALREYGAYMGDTGGPPSFGLMLESDATYTAFGTPSAMVTFAQQNGWSLYQGYYVGTVRTGVPWDRLRVLDWTDPANH